MNIKKADGLVTEVQGVVDNWMKYASDTKVEKELSKAIAATLLKV